MTSAIATRPECGSLTIEAEVLPGTPKAGATGDLWITREDTRMRSFTCACGATGRGHADDIQPFIAAHRDRIIAAHAN
jgi:hypothetical protein